MQVGARWLSEWCQTAQAGGSHVVGGAADDALALAVSRVLLASRSADEAAAELFDLLGDGSFDAIQQLLEHRYSSGAWLLACCTPQSHDEGGQTPFVKTVNTRHAQ